MENLTVEVKELKTKISKGINGWKGKTIRTEKGRTFEISTCKGRKFLNSIVREVEVNKDENFLSTTYVGSLLDAPFLQIEHSESSRATEKTISEAHFLALSKFDEKIESVEYVEETEKIYKPTIGDILFLEGYGKGKGSEENNHIIYKIEGKDYLTIEKDTLLLSRKNYVRDIRDVFGIGTYFSEGFNISTFNISNREFEDMLINAVELAKENQIFKRLEDKQKAEIAKEKENYLSQFTIADRRKTTSILKSHILENFKTVEKVEINSDIFSGGSSFYVTYYAPQEVEEIEILVNSLQNGKFNSMDDIYEYNNDEEVIINDHILMKYKYTDCIFKEIEETKEEEEVKPVQKNEESNKDLVISKYSEKAGVIYGNTKPHKDELKSLGCRFNPRLKIEEKIVIGWVFQISKFDEIKKHFKL